MRKIWDKHNNILLVLTVGYKQDAAQIVYKMWEVCNNHIGVGYYILQICRLIRSQIFDSACKYANQSRNNSFIF